MKKNCYSAYFLRNARISCFCTQNPQKIISLCNHYKIMLKLFTIAHFVMLKHLEHLVVPLPDTNWC